MGDIFAEQLVKRKKKPSEQFLKYALTALVVVFALGGLFVNGILVYMALALVIACYFVFPRFNVEYEYSYVNGEFDIDVIYQCRRERRKRSLICRTSTVSLRTATLPLPRIRRVILSPTILLLTRRDLPMSSSRAGKNVSSTCRSRIRPFWQI